MLRRIMDVISLVIGSIGVGIVVYCAVLAFIEIVLLEFRRIKGTPICKKREYLRHHLGSYLLIGLEFLIAADIIHSVFKPDLKSLTALGAIVAIRSVISFFLNKELKEGHDCASEGVRSLPSKLAKAKCIL